MYLYFSGQARTQNPNHYLGFITLSTFAYIAVFVLTALVGNAFESQLSRILPNGDEILPFVLFGSVGSSLVLAGLNYYLVSLTIKQFVRLTLLGGVLGLSFFAIPSGILTSGSGSTSGIPTTENVVGLLVLWQMGMMAGIGFLIQDK